MLIVLHGRHLHLCAMYFNYCTTCVCVPVWVWESALCRSVFFLFIDRGNGVDIILPHCRGYLVPQNDGKTKNYNRILCKKTRNQIEAEKQEKEESEEPKLTLFHYSFITHFLLIFCDYSNDDFLFLYLFFSCSSS